MSVTDPQALARQLDAEHPAIGHAVKWAAKGGRVLLLYGIRADYGTGADCAPGWSCACGDLACGRPGKHPPTNWAASTLSDPLEVAQAMRRAAYESGAVNWGRRLDPDWEGRVPVPDGAEVPNVDTLRSGAVVCIDVDDTDADGRLVMPDAIRAAMTPEDASYWETTGRGAHILGRLPDTVTVAQWRRVFGTTYYPDGTLESERKDGPEKKGGPKPGTGEARMRMVVGAGSRHKSGRVYELMTPEADVPVFSESLVRVLCGPPDAPVPGARRPLTEQDMPREGVDTEASRLIAERAKRTRLATTPGERNAEHNAQAFALGLQLRRHLHLVEYAREKLEKAATEARQVHPEKVDALTGEVRSETLAESQAEARRAVADGLDDGLAVPLPGEELSAPPAASTATSQGTPSGAQVDGSAPSVPAPNPAPQGTPNAGEQGSPEVPQEPASQGTPQGSPSSGPRIVTRALDTIGKPRRVRWLDCSIGEGRIPLGMATVIAGDPGVGKGTLGALIAAEVTRQGGTVLISSPEDNAHSVILPRMIAAGADRSRIILTGLAHEDDDPLAPFSIDLYAAQLAEKLETHGADMFLIDPLAEHIGTDVKDNKGTRDAIRPLLLAAEAHETALILNAHVNRAESSSWVKRITGSAAIGQIVRSVMLAGQLPKIAPTQDDMTVPQPVGLIHVKANNGPMQPGLRFQIETAEVEAEDGPMTTSRMRLCGTWNGREDDLLDERKRPTYEAIGAAAYWLRAELAPRGGVLTAKPVAEVHTDAKAVDPAWDEKIMRRAAKLIGARNAPIAAGGARYYTLEDYPLGD